jgi:hypothetical protein
MTKQLGMDLVSEDSRKYHVRVEQPGDSADDLILRVFKDDGVLMHVDEMFLNHFLDTHCNRRLFHARTGVLFSVDAYSVLRSWVLMIQELTR